MMLRLREPQARFSPCRIQIPPTRTIKTPMRLLITRITALNARLIAHLETKRSVSTCCGSTSKSSEEWAPEHVNASSIHVGRVVAYPDRTAFLGDYFRIGGDPSEISSGRIRNYLGSRCVSIVI